MLQDLDATLDKVLRAAKAEIPQFLEIDAVSFATPDDKFAPDGPTINLFLLDVVENRELRDVRQIHERVGQTVVMRPPPLRVDCTYLVTAWSNATGEAKAIQEHRLLGEALLWLSRFPTIPSAPNALEDPDAPEDPEGQRSLLVGSLEHSLYPPLLTLAHAREDRQSGHFWSALRIPPRPAFFLTATVSMHVEKALREARAVSDVVLRVGVTPGANGPTDGIHIIGGRVLAAPEAEGAEPAPVEGATVTLEPGGWSAITDVNGRYTFGPLSERRYRLAARATDFSDLARDVEVPLADAAAAYDLILTRP